MRILLMGLVALTTTAASPASAALLMFDFTGRGLGGPVAATFQLDSNPVPDMTNDPGFGIQQIFFNNVPGVFNGNAETATTIAFGKGLAAQFQILGTSAGFAQFGGDEVFSGTLDKPIFRAGTYNFTGLFSSGTLTISEVDVAAAVPEPASWLTMILGFGLVGVAVRRRVAAPAVGFAA